MENNGLSGKEPTQEELQSLFDAGFKNVQTEGSNESELRKLLKPENKVEEPAEEQEPEDEEESKESTEQPEEHTEEEPAKEKPKPSKGKTETIPDGGEPVKNKGQDAGKPSKSADRKDKPSVFDEARGVLDKLPEDQRKTVGRLLNHAANLDRRKAELDQKIRSDDGRVSAMQRTIDELRNQVAFLKSQTPSNKQPASDGAGAAKAITRGDIKSYIESDPDLKELYENDPATAELLAKQQLVQEQKTEEKLKKLQKVEEKPAEVVDELDEAYLKTQGQIIRQAHPNVNEILNLPEFGQWISTAPGFIKRQINSPHGEEVVDVLDRFMADYQAYKAWEQAQNAEDEPDEEPVVRTKNRADQITEQRNKRVKANAGAPSAAAQPRKGVEPSLEELFESGYKKKLKEIYGG